MDNLGGHVLVVEDVLYRRALGHEDHEEGYISAGIGQQQRSGHGTHGGPAHVHAGFDSLSPADVGPLLHNLIDGGGDVHRQIHDRPGGTDKDGSHKNPGQIQVLVSGIEQALGALHDGAVDFEQVGEGGAQQAGHQNAQGGAGHGGQGAAVKAVDQGDNQDGQAQGDGQPDKDGVKAFEVEGDQNFPQHQDSQHEGEDGPYAGAAGKEDEQRGKEQGQQRLRTHTVVVNHGDVGDAVLREADHHQRPVAGGEELVLLHRPVEHIDAHCGLAFEAPAQQLQRAALLAGADQPGVDNGGVVHAYNQSGAAVCLLVLHGVLIPGGQEHQNHNEQQAQGHRGIVAALGRVSEKGIHIDEDILSVSADGCGRICRIRLLFYEEGKGKIRPRPAYRPACCRSRCCHSSR